MIWCICEGVDYGTVKNKVLDDLILISARQRKTTSRKTLGNLLELRKLHEDSPVVT